MALKPPVIEPNLTETTAAREALSTLHRSKAKSADSRTIRSAPPNSASCRCNGSKAGAPKRHDLAKLNQCLSNNGYWHCGCHTFYMGSKVPGPDSNGLYAFINAKFPKYTVRPAPRNYILLRSTQMKGAATVPVPDSPLPQHSVPCCPADAARVNPCTVLAGPGKNCHDAHASHGTHPHQVPWFSGRPMRPPRRTLH